MSSFWSKTAKGVTPYVPGEQPQDKQYIKLNTNENPYPPSPKVLEAIQDAASLLRLYPDPEALELRKAIAKHFGLSHQEVFVGNGSDEVLAFAFMAFFMPDRPVVYPDITYTFYEVYASLFGVKATTIPVREDFTIDIRPYCTDRAGVIMANPNAPTGLLLGLKEVETIVRSNPNNVVIIDEAYVDFGGQSAVTLVRDCPNLLVVQTFSKSRALAGMRVGFAIGSTELIEGLNRIKDSINSYPLDRLALACAKAAIEDDQYFKDITQRIIKTREGTRGALRAMGFNVLDSKANFVFVSHSDIHAAQLFKELRERGILTRHFPRPRIDNFLRVTIGTEEQMSQFIEALREVIADRQ
jgi:histidinol-phosphate aminotransferase